MKRILFVIPSLGYTGPARQLTLLATHLRRAAFDIHVCVLGSHAPLAKTLRAAGVPVDVLHWKHLIDMPAWERLRTLIHQFRLDRIHCWQRTALRAVELQVHPRRCRVIASAFFEPEAGHVLPGRIDRWFLNRVDQLIARGPHEVRLCKQLHLPESKIHLIPPAIERFEARSAGVSSEELSRFQIGETSQVLVTLGELERHAGLRDAIWTQGILNYVYPDLHLILAGEGRDRETLESFARATAVADRVHFVAPDREAAWLARCSAVWIPRHIDGGRHSALAAMAAGRPVVATQLPSLSEIVVEDVTGFLVPKGDKVALARQTRLLLDDPARTGALGEAGRRRVADHFGVEQFLERHIALYAV